MKGTATQQNHKMKSKKVKRRAERRNMMAMLTLAPAQNTCAESYLQMMQRC